MCRKPGSEWNRTQRWEAARCIEGWMWGSRKTEDREDTKDTQEVRQTGRSDWVGGGVWEMARRRRREGLLRTSYGRRRFGAAMMTYITQEEEMVRSGWKGASNSPKQSCSESCYDSELRSGRAGYRPGGIGEATAFREGGRDMDKGFNTG